MKRDRDCVFASLNCVILRLHFQSSRRLIEFIVIINLDMNCVCFFLIK